MMAHPGIILAVAATVIYNLGFICEKRALDRLPAIDVHRLGHLARTLFSAPPFPLAAERIEQREPWSAPRHCGARASPATLVSPAFGCSLRSRPAKPGDPPPASRPSAAEAPCSGRAALKERD